MPRHNFPIRQLQRDKEWLSAHLCRYGAYIKGLIPDDISDASIIRLDLSTYNPALAQVEEQREVLSYIRDNLLSSSAIAAISGYAEERRDFLSGQRITHLGLDVLSMEDLPVLAPVNGRFYAVRNEQTSGDIKIAIQHRLGAFRFYSILSHISGATRTLHRPGSPVMAGELLGYAAPGYHHHAGLCLLHFSVVIEAGYELFDIPEDVETARANDFLCMLIDPAPLLRAPAAARRRIIDTSFPGEPANGREGGCELGRNGLKCRSAKAPCNDKGADAALCIHKN